MSSADAEKNTENMVEDKKDVTDEPKPAIDIKATDKTSASTKDEKAPENNKTSKSNKDDDDISENDELKSDIDASTEDDGKSETDKKDKDKPSKAIPVKIDKKEKENDKEKDKESSKNDKEKDDEKNDKEEEDDGSISLGEIEKINANINKTRVEQLQVLYTICYDIPGKSNVVKKNLRNFAGFEFELDSDDFKKRVEATLKNDLKHLKSICDILVLDKRGSKEEISERICQFLLAPDPEGLHVVQSDAEPDEEAEEEEEEEEDEHPPPPPKKQKSRGGREEKLSKSSSGRPKRASAGRGFNRDYSSSDESDERFTKPKQSRRRNASDSESDYNPSGGSDSDAGKKRSARNQRGRQPTRRAASRKHVSESEDEPSPSEEDSDAEPQPKKTAPPSRRSVGKRSSGPPAKKKKNNSESEESEAESDASESAKKSKKVAPKNSKSSPTNNKSKNSIPPKGKSAGRPKRAATKPAKKDNSDSEEEEDNDKEDEKDEESEDEPLSKKAKPSSPTPPNDDEIKAYVKEILDDANLEEITMKTVCKQVYAKYPTFDLSHKKDFIKNTVKSLIST